MKGKSLSRILCMMMLFLLATVNVFAADAPKIDTGDTTFILVSAALVFFMTPGLAFFYGGMVRKKNVLNTLMSVFIVIGIVTIQWVLFGYSIAFGPDQSGVIGSLSYLGLNGVGGAPNADYAATIPHSTFMVFQLMFAIITAGLIVGSLVERMKFSAFVIFILLWTTLVYDPLAHWVWAVGGWIRTLGALDFAGGTVVHISSGIAGLVGAIVLGKRKGYGTTPMMPHNLPLILIGAGILWIGWFGFNAGSALAANDLASSAFVVTHISASAALVSWSLIEYIHRGKATLLGAATGALAGLVAITPAAGFVTPVPAIFIGLIASPLCYFGITTLKAKLGYDDALDAFGCHGIGGIWGAIATGLFATKSVNALGANGLFYGDPSLLVKQIIGVVATILFSGVLTFVILKVISLFTPLRVEEEKEENGLDIEEHGEDAYPDFLGSQGFNM